VAKKEEEEKKGHISATHAKKKGIFLFVQGGEL
jgi:hypothetical protein